MQVHGKTGGEAQEWVRSMLATCGRGGNAQAVRDEILNIMHRNNIGEKRGTWMEVNLSSPSPLPLPSLSFLHLCHGPACLFCESIAKLVSAKQVQLQL